MLYASTKSAITDRDMKLDDTKVKYICQKAMDKLKEKKLIVFKVEEHVALNCMIEAFNKNLKEEQNIELEAKKMMEAHKSEMLTNGMNQSKMFMLIKKEIARKRGFIL